MRVIIFGFHMTFLTAIEDHLSRKQVEFLYLGKNVNEEYRDEIVYQFNTVEKYRAIILDLGEDLSDIEFTTETAVLLIGEVIWDSKKMEEAENVIKVKG